jgi:hypothetical protein
MKFPPQKAEEGLSSQFKQIDQNNGFGGGFGGMGRDDDDGKNKKKTKKTSTATGGKGPMIGSGISASKEAEMLKQQLK